MRRLPAFLTTEKGRENLGPIQMQRFLVQLELGERAAARIEQAVPELHAARIVTESDAARSRVLIGGSAVGAVFFYSFPENACRLFKSQKNRLETCAAFLEYTNSLLLLCRESPNT